MNGGVPSGRPGGHIDAGRAMAVSVLGALVFTAYMISMNKGVALPLPVFWTSALGMLAPLVILCTQDQAQRVSSRGLVLMTVVLAILLRLLYQIPEPGLFGSDVFMDFNSARGILTTSHIRVLPEYSNGTSFFPPMHLLGAMMAQASGLPIEAVAKWMPSLLTGGMIALVVTTAKRLLANMGLACLAGLLLACVQQNMMFGSLFIRETIALVYAVACVYCVTVGGTPSRYLSIMFGAMCVLAHHLTSFLLVVFFVLRWVALHAPSRAFTDLPTSNETQEERHSLPKLALFVSALMLSYWVYVVTQPIYSLTGFLQDLLSLSSWGHGTYGEGVGAVSPFQAGTRTAIVMLGQLGFTGALAALLGWELAVRRRFTSRRVLAHALYIGVCGTTGFVLLYIVPMTAIPYPDRFLTHGWVFGSVAVAWSLGNLMRRTTGLRLCQCIVVAFALFNLWLVNPSLWDSCWEGGTLTRVGQQEYAFASRLDFFSQPFATHPALYLAVYDTHLKMGANLYVDDEPLPTDISMVLPRTDLELPDTTVNPLGQEPVEVRCLDASQGWNRVASSRKYIGYAQEEPN